ncbi:MAG TPA: PKD domain-containing protein, partial [Vicinamibacterales bacterium]|nr:PKD domain-containing protein [Vicinamibacterales bacterium]
PVLQPQSITFTSSPPDSATVGGSYSPSASGGGSGNPVTFTSLTPPVCGVSGADVSFLAGGTCTVAADQAGNAWYLPADQVTQSFEINSRPVANAGNSQSGNEGSTITFDASASSDPDGDALIRYTWDFGDGTVESVTTPTVRHVYADNKADGSPYLATLTVVDAKGATSQSASLSVLISNVAPSATFAPASPVGEGTIDLSLTGVQDAPIDVTTLQYAFDCGDGTGYTAFGASASFTCPVPDNGMRSVRARLRDKDGAVSEYSESVTVVNVAPTITIITGPASGKTGADYTLAFKFADPGTGDGPWVYQITWGDGKRDPGPKPATVQGLTITEKYRYTKPGSYTITVRVTDKDGGTETSSVQVMIVK